MKFKVKLSSGLFSKCLIFVEKAGNALPHPATLFAACAFLVLVFSWLMSLLDLSVVHPGNGNLIAPVNLLSLHGLHLIITKLVKNFTSFAPLGTVLVAMLGIGIAESSGFISTALRMIVLSAPQKLLTFIIVYCGVMSNIASDVGYVLLVPLGATIFLSAGRHPVAGLAAAFAGVSGGFSANMLLGTVDPLLSGLSEEAAKIITPGYLVNPSCNYYFMFISAILISLAGTWVTEKIVIPMLGEYKGTSDTDKIHKLSSDEKRGLKWATIAGIIFILILLLGTLPENGFLRNPETGTLFRSPLLKGIVTLIFTFFIILGTAYGIGAKTIKTDQDVIDGMSKSMSSMAVYIVLAFFAAQFLAYFKWSNLGIIFAIHGANILKASGLGTIPLMIAFIILAATLNLFMGSASAKWAIISPVFVPMFMLLGYTPELTQATYRIGDSITNIIAPMMPYFALVVAFVNRYDKKAGMGTVIATMLPYSITFGIMWTFLLITWILLKLPLGPGASLFLN